MVLLGVCILNDFFTLSAFHRYFYSKLKFWIFVLENAKIILQLNLCNLLSIILCILSLILSNLMPAKINSSYTGIVKFFFFFYFR